MKQSLSFLVTAFLVVVLLGLHQPSHLPDQPLVGSELALVDDQGNLYCYITTAEQGASLLSLGQSSNPTNITMISDKDRSFVMFGDKRPDENSVAMGIDSDGVGTMAMTHDHAVRAKVIVGDPDKESGLYIADEWGNTTHRLTWSRGGGSTLSNLFRRRDGKDIGFAAVANENVAILDGVLRDPGETTDSLMAFWIGDWENGSRLSSILLGGDVSFVQVKGDSFPEGASDDFLKDFAEGTDTE